MPRKRSHLVVGTSVGLLLLPIVVQLVLVPVPGAGSYIVLSGSMAPAIPSGALVYVLETGNYAQGDVITYAHEGATVTHRIVGETSNGLHTKGDANDARDPYVVKRAQVHGEVVLTVPAYGALLQSILRHRFLALAGLGWILVVLGIRLLTADPPPDLLG